MDNGFGIRFCGKAMASLQQALAQFGIIVDFAVEQYPNAAIFIRNRLMAAGNIDDAQPAVSEANVRSQMNTGVVRTAVLQRIIHALNELRGNPVRLVKVNNAADTTHGCSSVAIYLQR